MTKFRLAPVLRIREMQERVAAGEAARALAAVRAAEAVAADLGAQVRAVAAPEVAPATEFLNTLAHGHRLLDDAAQARRVVADRAQAAQAAQAEWTGAARSMKVMEKLAERHRQQVNSTLEHAEIRAIDDLVTRTYAVRSQSEGLL